MFFSDTDQQNQLDQANRSPTPAGPVPSFGEAAGVALDASLRSGITNQEANNQFDFLQGKLDDYRQKTGEALFNPMGLSEAPTYTYGSPTPATRGQGLADLRAKFAAKGLPFPSDQDIAQGGLNLRRQALTAEEQSEQAQQGVGSVIGRFIGGSIPVAADPLNIAALGVLPEAGLAGKILSSAAVFGGTQAVNEALTFGYRKQADPNFGIGEAATGVAEAAVGAAVGTAAFEGAGWAAGALWRRMKARTPAVADRIPQELQDAGNAAERQADLAANNPFPASPAAEAAHNEAIAKVADDLQNGRPPELPPSAESLPVLDIPVGQAPASLSEAAARASRAVEQGFTYEAVHATHTDFDEFDLAKAGTATDTGLFGRGMYFFPMEHAGEEGYNFGRIEGQRQIPVRLRMRNPFEVMQEADGTFHADWAALKAHGYEHDTIPGFVGNELGAVGDENAAEAEAFRKALKSAGYDGVISRARLDDGSAPIEEMVSFDTANIRSKYDAFHPDAAHKSGLFASSRPPLAAAAERAARPLEGEIISPPKDGVHEPFVDEESLHPGDWADFFDKPDRGQTLADYMEHYGYPHVGGDDMPELVRWWRKNGYPENEKTSGLNAQSITEEGRRFVTPIRKVAQRAVAHPDPDVQRIGRALDEAGTDLPPEVAKPIADAAHAVMDAREAGASPAEHLHAGPDFHSDATQMAAKLFVKEDGETLRSVADMKANLRGASGAERPERAEAEPSAPAPDLAPHIADATTPEAVEAAFKDPAVHDALTAELERSIEQGRNRMPVVDENGEPMKDLGVADAELASIKDQEELARQVEACATPVREAAE